MPEYSRFTTEVLLPCGFGTVPYVEARHARFRLEAGPSPIDRWGVFAAEPIGRRRLVIEYTGEWITQEVAEFRMLRERLYLFEWDDDWVIDGAIGGSGAQFINHSCAPNLTFRRWRKRVFFLSLRAIAPGEELTLDYRIPADADAQPCNCGARTCRGTLTAAEAVVQ
jgi:SET domain-containing protein